MENIRIDTTVKLNNGIEMPILGLGTYQSGNVAEARHAVLHAFDAGYRQLEVYSPLTKG